MNKRITTIVLSALVGLMVCALSVTCTENPEYKAAERIANMQEPESRTCTEKIISCGFDHICPYPGQHIEVAHTGGPSCGDTICICRCSPSKEIRTGEP